MKTAMISCLCGKSDLDGGRQAKRKTGKASLQSPNRRNSGSTEELHLHEEFFTVFIHLSVRNTSGIIWNNYHLIILTSGKSSHLVTI